MYFKVNDDLKLQIIKCLLKGIKLNFTLISNSLLILATSNDCFIHILKLKGTNEERNIRADDTYDSIVYLNVVAQT